MDSTTQLSQKENDMCVCVLNGAPRSQLTADDQFEGLKLLKEENFKTINETTTAARRRFASVGNSIKCTPFFIRSSRPRNKASKVFQTGDQRRQCWKIVTTRIITTYTRYEQRGYDCTIIKCSCDIFFYEY